jgi:hypothetical protein
MYSRWTLICIRSPWLGITDRPVTKLSSCFSTFSSPSSTNRRTHSQLCLLCNIDELHLHQEHRRRQPRLAAHEAHQLRPPKQI